MVALFPLGGGVDDQAPRRVLTVNAGTRSIKVRLLEPAKTDAGPAGWRRVASWDRPVADPCLVPIVEAVDDGRLLAVAHRVVAAGGGRAASAVVDDELAAKLLAAAEHFPLEDVPGLTVLRACREVTNVPQVACSDAAFFATMPAVAATYAVPWEWDRQLGTRVVGRHGLSHAWADARGRLLVGPGAHRVVTCHLGWSASLAAVLDGRCVDTTSGFSGSDGLVTATGSGTVDPGLVTYVQERLRWTPARMRHALERESGVAGLSGLTGDMTALLRAERLGNERAALAIGVYLRRFRANLAAMAAALGGLDVVVFTGGVAENNAELVRRACRGLEFLGLLPLAEPLREDPPSSTGDRVVSLPQSRVTVAVLAAGEDAQMAMLTDDLLSTVLSR